MDDNYPYVGRSSMNINSALDNGQYGGTKTPAQQILDQQGSQEALGWTPKGFEQLNNGLQEQAFNKAADIIGAQKGQNANETAGNVVSQVTEPLGHSTAANILRTALQTGATLGLNPANLIAPGGPKMLGGTVNNTADQAIARKLAREALETGDMSGVNAAVKLSKDNLVNIVAPRSKPSGLEVLRGTRPPVNARGVKIIEGANEIATPNVRPASPTGVKYIPASNPLETGVVKFQNGSLPSTMPGTSMMDVNGRMWTMQELADALQKKGLK